MSNLRSLVPVSPSQLQACQETITKLLLEDCTTGARVEKLPSGVYACGQFLHQPDRLQRGIHGTAAAIRVLGPSSVQSDAARIATMGLVDYVSDRESIERSIHIEDYDRHEWERQLRHDSINTIKNAELLYALQFVPRGVRSTGQIVEKTLSRVMGGKSRRGPAWSYLLHPPAEPVPLPTAHVFRALATHGYPVADTYEWLIENCERRIRNEVPVEAAYEQTFVLLALLDYQDTDTATVRRLLNKLWPVLRGEMDRTREFNQPILDGDRNDYIRVPWQLHLAALSAHVRPWTLYVQPRIQRILRETVEPIINADGFRFPDEGGLVSTRTHGIVFDTIAAAGGTRAAWVGPTAAIGTFLAALEKPTKAARLATEVVVALMAVFLVTMAVIKWIASDQTPLVTLGSAFAATVVLGFLRRRPRR